MQPFYPGFRALVLWLAGRTARAIAPAVLLGVAVFLGGCGIGAPRLGEVSPLDRGVVAVESRCTLAGASVFRVGIADADDRVASDIERAFERCGWAKLRIETDGGESGQFTHRHCGAALLDDGRTASVLALETKGREVLLAVRVGPFGDGTLERYYARVLAGSLADRRRPRRDSTFELPP